MYLHSNMVIFKPEELFKFTREHGKNLHSNMVIFKLKNALDNKGFIVIYIPIWLYLSKNP